jgi:hypothetical protein
MNKLQEKANELIAIANSFGIECQTQERGDYAVDVFYKVRGGRLVSVISYTDNGRARVETRESNARKIEKVSLKSLPEILEYHGERAKRLRDIEEANGLIKASA